MTTQESAPPAPSVVPTPSFSELVRVFARIGLLSFGGPAGQIALMHRELVEERRWLDERSFLHALNYCMILPGPEAMQLATYAGWLMHGTKGGLAAGLLFLLPGAVLITALSVLYFLLGDAPAVEGLLFGLKAAVLAIVLEALIRISRRALKSGVAVAIAVMAFVAIAFLGIPFPLIILAAAAIGAALHFGAPSVEEVEGPMPSGRPVGLATFAATLAIWLVVWFGPLLALHLILGGSHVLSQQASFFSVMAAVTFGGAYAVLAYVAQQAVEAYGWLRPDEMLTGLGLAETTPGPLILVLVFVGFLGAARAVETAGVAGGLLGAAVALWFTFVPCFLWIFVGAPFVERLRGVRWLNEALSAVTAAVVGIIANLALWFGLHVLFSRIDSWSLGPLSMPRPDWSSLDVAALAIAAAAGVALMRFHVNMIAVIFAAAALGAVLRLAG